MKRGFMAVFGIISILILSGSASAISTDLKESYERGETIIIEIFGNIIEPIAKEQVDFRRGHVSVPFEYDLKKLGGRYFLWAIAPENENNYTLVVEDIATVISGQTEKIDFEQNFSIGGNLTDYSIKPGFIYAFDDFEIEAQLNEDLEKTIGVEFPNSSEIVLKPGKNIIKFPISEVGEGLTMTNIGKYIVPVYIVGKNINESLDEGPKLRLNPKSIISKIVLDEVIEYPFIIVNFGDEKISGIELEYNKELFYINVNGSIDIGPKNHTDLNISIINAAGNDIDEIIYIRASNFTIELPVKISFTRNESEVNTPYLDENVTLYYCEELEGKICKGGEVCSGKISASIDGACCIGECVVRKEEKSKAWIGWLLAGIVLIGILWLFFRYRKTKNVKDGFAKRVSEAEEKISIFLTFSAL